MACSILETQVTALLLADVVITVSKIQPVFVIQKYNQSQKFIIKNKMSNEIRCACFVD